MIPTGDPAKLGFDPDRLARLKPWMQHWVDEGKFPGAQCLIARHGQIAYCDQVGMADIESGKPWQRDTIARIYSMTKPITSVALMMLYEDALCQLDQPVDEFIPELADRQVLIEGATSIDQTRPAETRMTLHHLLNHTSGYTYSFNEGLLSEAMLEHKLDFGPRQGPLTDTVKRLAGIPLAFDPGARWNYGVSTDLVGRVVEVISGQSLDVFFRERILGPLGMDDTAFEVAPQNQDRLATCYVKTDDDPLMVMDPGATSVFHQGRVKQYSGGGGLTAPIDDYIKFAEMMRCGGTLGDTRLLSPKAVELMTRNSLPGDLVSMGQPAFAEVPFDGVGFGLGVFVTLNAGLAKTASSDGDHGWGGMASTFWWNDPEMDTTAIFFTQLVPSSSYPNRKEFRALMYSSLVDPSA